jgi:hypothetical protein
VNVVRAIEGSLLAFLVTSVFISTLWYPSFWVMMGFMVALRNTVTGLVDKQDVSTAAHMDRDQTNPATF